MADATANLVYCYQQACLAKQPPNWDLAPGAQWSLALAELTNTLGLAELLQITTWFNVAFPDDAHGKFMLALCQQAIQLKPLVPFSERAQHDYELHSVEGSNKALLVFCGGSHRVGFPLHIAHQWFGALGVNIVYLFDTEKSFYFRGLSSVEGGFDNTILFLKQLLAPLGIKHYYCYGSSLGSYAAIRASVALQAKAALCFAGPTNLTADFLIENAVYSKRLPLVLSEPENALDLRMMLLQQQLPTQVIIYFGEENKADALHAYNLAGLDNVFLKPVKGVNEHNVVRHVILANNWLPQLLEFINC